MTMTGLKALATKAVELVSALPVSFIIKAGVLVGVSVFSAWVLIQRARKMHKEAHAEPHNNRRYSPVDELLGKHAYTSDPYAFDGMDEIARDICSDSDIFSGMRPKKKGKKKKKKYTESQKRRAREVQKNVRHATSREFGDFFKGFSKSWMDEVDEAARELGLPVECYSCDDGITPEIREKYSMLF